MTSTATFYATVHSLVFTLLLLLLPLESQKFVWAAPALGRATFYGKGDGFTLNDGSCACHKRWGWLSNRCESGHCFDYIGNLADRRPNDALECQHQLYICRTASFFLSGTNSKLCQVLHQCLK